MPLALPRRLADSVEDVERERRPKNLRGGLPVIDQVSLLLSGTTGPGRRTDGRAWGSDTPAPLTPGPSCSAGRRQHDRRARLGIDFDAHVLAALNPLLHGAGDLLAAE